MCGKIIKIADVNSKSNFCLPSEDTASWEHGILCDLIKANLVSGD